MTSLKKIGKNIMVLKKNPKIFLYYIIGNYRYQVYYSKNFKWLLRKSVKYNLGTLTHFINKECFNNASCKDCGCDVPQQNFGGKPCDCFWININGEIKTDYFKTPLRHIKNNNSIDFSVLSTKEDEEEVVKDIEKIIESKIDVSDAIFPMDTDSKELKEVLAKREEDDNFFYNLWKNK
jgi:hypothetical protein